MRTPAKDGAARKAPCQRGLALVDTSAAGWAAAAEELVRRMPRWVWLDVLGKVQEEVVVRSTASSIITVIAWIAIVSVVLGEFNYYMNPQPTAEVTIDRTGIQNMNIDFTIRLPNLPCDNFGVDALDSSGNMLLEVKTNIKKEKIPPERGCKVIGTLAVSGEFHIGFGRDSEAVHKEGLDSMEGNHIHRFNMQQARDFNTSHIVEHLGFTVPRDDKLHPLFRFFNIRVDKMVPNNTARFLYFINVVAVANSEWGSPVYGYDYVWRLHKIDVDTSQPRFWQPGVFFKYSLEPYVMNYGYEERSFTETILRCVATGGGIYVVAGWASSFIYYIQKLRNPRQLR